MNKVNLNTKGNSMAGGDRAIIKFYEDMIEQAKNNIGKTTEYNTIIDKNFLLVLENRLSQLKY